MNVLLVDDHSIVRRGLRELFLEAFSDVRFQEAETGEQAIVQAEQHLLELVVMDLSMPGRGGLEALKELQSRFPELPVIVLTHHSERQYAVRALRAGARAYLTKDALSEELIVAAQKVLSGGRYISAALAETLAEAIEGKGKGKDAHELLSDRELQVLRLIAQGTTAKDIAAQLSLSEKTISTYRTRLLEKMRMKNNAELMRYALGARLVE